jgi:hypothetical protein
MTKYEVKLIWIIEVEAEMEDIAEMHAQAQLQDELQANELEFDITEIKNKIRKRKVTQP